MNNQDNCQNRREAIAALVLGVLDTKNADELRRHIEACQGCRKLYQDMLDEEKDIRTTFQVIADKGQILQSDLIEKLDKNESATSPPPKTIKAGWGKIIRNPLIKFAVATVFIIVITGLHQFNISIKGTSVVWADVAERLKNVSSYKSQGRRVLTEVGQEEPFFQCEILRYFSPEHGSIEESYENGELVMLAYCSISEKLALIILPKNKLYFRFELNEELLSVVEYTNPANTDGMTKLFGSERCTRLGSRKFDDVSAEGFEVKDVKVLSQVPQFLLHTKGFDIRMWVNRETLLPIRVEGEGFVNKSLMSGLKDFKYEEVMLNIEYDVQIDESIFEPNIPDDYILIDPANLAEKSELTMLGIVPCGAVIIVYKNIKKRRNVKYAVDNT